MSLSASEHPPTLDEIRWADEPLLPPRRDPVLEARLRKAHGAVPLAAPYLAHLPWLAEAFFFTEARLAAVPLDLLEFISLVVSQDNSCRYCYGTQRFLLKALGYDERRIRELERDLYINGMTPRDKLALDFVRQVSRCNPRPSRAEVEALRRAGFGDLAIKEMALLAAQVCFFNRVATMLTLPPEIEIERTQEKWYFPVLRPLIRWKLRSDTRGSVTSLSEPPHGPCAPLIRALDGSPAASALSALIEAALDSPVLPRRAKLLVFAVVSRAVGCDGTRSLVEPAIMEEGMAPEALKDALAHLSSPALTPLETDLLPFARDTVRYRYDAIQARAREFAHGRAPAEVLEAIGVTSLANYVTRLGMLLEAN